MPHFKDGDGRVLSRIDNTQSVAAIENGYSPVQTLDKLNKAETDYAISIGLDLAAIHIPGDPDNWKADGLSRPGTAKFIAAESSDQALAGWARSEIERFVGTQHDAEAFADGLGLQAGQRKRCWMRRSFLEAELRGCDWLVNPHLTLLRDTVEHMARQSKEQWSATLVWQRTGTREERRAREKLPGLGFRLAHTWPERTEGLFVSRPVLYVLHVCAAALPPLSPVPSAEWRVEVWRRQC
jgi:hypothetical protein